MIELTVYGCPAPQGSKKFVGHAKSTGRAILVESSKKVKPWREDVKGAAEFYLASTGRAPIAGAVVAEMIFTVAKPKSAPKTRRTYPSTKPDLSKLLRSTEDALSDAGIWGDDARVIRYSNLAKVFPGEHPRALERPGVRIRLWSMEEVERHQLERQQQASIAMPKQPAAPVTV